MGSALRLSPGEATQEVINQIERDASMLAPPSSSTVPAPKQKFKGKNGRVKKSKTSFRSKKTK